MTTWTNAVIAIPTMPSRRALLAQLGLELERQCPQAALVAREHVDGADAREDLPALAALALESARRGARGWIVIVEDDIWPAPVFGERVSTALDSLASEVGGASFFSRSVRDAEAMARGETWRRQAPAAFAMMQCVAVRAPVLDGFPEWAPSWYAAHPAHRHAADLLLGAWLARRRTRMLVHVPSLVQHRDVPTTLPRRGGARQSETYRRAFGEPPAAP